MGRHGGSQPRSEIFELIVFFSFHFAQDSSIVRRSVGTWRSLVAHYNGVVGVGGSNPLVPTKIIQKTAHLSRDRAVFFGRF